MATTRRQRELWTGLPVQLCVAAMNDFSALVMLKIMDRKTLIAKIAGATETSKQEAEQMVDAIFAHIGEALRTGEKIDLRGFGSFQVSPKKQRQGRNPRTGEMMTIPAKKITVFKASKQLLERVNGTDTGEAPSDEREG